MECYCTEDLLWVLAFGAFKNLNCRLSLSHSIHTLDIEEIHVTLHISQRKTTGPQSPIVVYLGTNTNDPTLPVYKSRKIHACFNLTRNPYIVRAMKMRLMY